MCESAVQRELQVKDYVLKGFASDSDPDNIGREIDFVGAFTWETHAVSNIGSEMLERSHTCPERAG